MSILSQVEEKVYFQHFVFVAEEQMCLLAFRNTSILVR